MEERIEELNKRIEEWKNELDTVWKDKNTDAAEVERRNLRNLIDNAKKEIVELKGENIKEELPEPKKFLDELKELKNKTETNIKKLNLSLEKLKEERKMYESKKNGAYKDIYDEISKRMEEIKEELEIMAEKEIYEDKDKTIRTLTQGRMETEKDIKNIKKQIRDKQKEIEDIEYGIDDAMEEIELSDGSKVKVPKINRFYKELDKLKEQLKEKETLRDEFQKYIDDIKGYKDKYTEYNEQQNSEYLKYFNGQGDIKENTRDDRRSNDEYFGFEGNNKGNAKQPQKTDPIPPTVSQGEVDNKPAPLYWQVYNKVATEHCSSPARFMYNMSKTTILPWNQNMSTPEKFLSVVGTVWRAPAKLIGYIGTKITGTDKKYEKMREAVNNLTAEEFSVLTDTKQEAKQRGIIEKNELDFEFTANTMRAFKHNTLALDAIAARVNKETAIMQKLTRNARNQIEAKIEMLNEKLKDKDIKPEVKEYIESELKKYNLEILPRLEQQEAMQVAKKDRIANGIEHRTAKYKDTEGWILGKFNPNNIEANQTMQEYQEDYIDAVESGDSKKIDEIRKEMVEFANGQTKTVTVGKNIHNRISRGNYAFGDIKVLNQTPQTIGKQILANFVTLAVFEHIFTTIKNQQMVNQAVAAENTKITDANVQNANILYSETKKVDVTSEMGVNLESAKQGVENTATMAHHGIGEYGNLSDKAGPGGSWSGGLNTPKYIVDDKILHDATTKQIANGDLSSAIDLLNDTIGKYESAMEAYAKTHNFDYSILKAMDTKGLSEVESLFTKLETPFEITIDGVTSGVQIASMGDIALKNFNLDLIATLAASQSGNLVSTQRKSKEEREARRQAKVAGKEEKRKDKEEKYNKRKEQDVNEI